MQSGGFETQRGDVEIVCASLRARRRRLVSPRQSVARQEWRVRGNAIWARRRLWRPRDHMARRAAREERTRAARTGEANGSEGDGRPLLRDARAHPTRTGEPDVETVLWRAGQVAPTWILQQLRTQVRSSPLWRRRLARSEGVPGGRSGARAGNRRERASTHRRDETRKRRPRFFRRGFAPADMAPEARQRVALRLYPVHVPPRRRRPVQERRGSAADPDPGRETSRGVLREPPQGGGCASAAQRADQNHDPAPVNLKRVRGVSPRRKRERGVHPAPPRRADRGASAGEPGPGVGRGRGRHRGRDAGPPGALRRGVGRRGRGIYRGG